MDVLVHSNLQANEGYKEGLEFFFPKVKDELIYPQLLLESILKFLKKPALMSKVFSSQNIQSYRCTSPKKEAVEII